MVLEDVAVEAMHVGGPMSPPGLRARAMSIVTSAGRVRTPARIISRSEHVARSKAAVSRALPHELAMDFRMLPLGDVAGLAGESAVARRLVRSARQFQSYTKRAALSMSVYQPDQSALADLSAADKVEFADAQAEFLQKNLGAELLTYPYLGLPASEYVRFIAERQRRNESCTTLFVLDMAMPPDALEKVVEYMAGTRQPAILPLIYRDPSSTIPQHMVVSRCFDSPRMATIACHVPRVLPGTRTSGLHAAYARSGYDMVVLQQNRGHGARRLDLDKIRFFSRRTLEIDPVRHVLMDRGRRLVDEFYLNGFNGPDRLHIAGMLGGLEGAAPDREGLARLFYLARMHEALNSPREFELMRDMILEGRIGEYASRVSALGAASGSAEPTRQAMLDDFLPAARPGRGRRDAPSLPGAGAREGGAAP